MVSNFKKKWSRFTIPMAYYSERLLFKVTVREIVRNSKLSQ